VPVTLSRPSRAQLHFSRMRSSALNLRKMAPCFSCWSDCTAAIAAAVPRLESVT
jgi:hypothetical protein